MEKFNHLHISDYADRELRSSDYSWISEYRHTRVKRIPRNLAFLVESPNRWIFRSRILL